MKSSIRLCNKHGPHQGRPIEHLCLEETCKKHRFLCSFCFFESHRTHRIAPLHKELGGAISNLQKNLAQNQKLSQENTKFFAETYKQMVKGCDDLGKMASNKLRSVKSYLTPQYALIQETFKKNSADEIIQDLTSNTTIKAQKMEKYVSLLKFYDQGGTINIYEVKQQWGSVTNTFENYLSQTSLIIQKALEEFVNKVSQLDYRQQKEQEVQNLSKEERPNVDLDHSIAISMNIQRQPQSSQMIQEIMEEEHQVKSIMQQIQQEVAQDQIDIEVQEEKNEKQMFRPNILKNDINERFAYQNNAVADHSSSSLENVVAESASEEYWIPSNQDMTPKPQIQTKLIQMDLRTKQKHPSQQKVPSNENMEIPAEQQYEQGHDLAEPFVDRIRIKASSPQEIISQLKRLNPMYVSELSITCDSCLCALNQESVSLIAKMKDMQKLSVNWTRGLPSALVIEMLFEMKNLRDLCLSQFDDLTYELIDFLRTNNQKLKRLYFTFDYINNLKIYQENLEFIKDMTIAYVDQVDWRELSSGLKLTNLQLYDASELLFWKDYIMENAQSLKEITIIRSNKVEKRDYTRFFNYLSCCKKIEAIRIQLIDFEEVALIEVIKNNPNIRTFYCSQCPNVTNKTMRALQTSCSRLKQLCIYLSDGINGKNIYTFSRLQTLILRGVWGLDEKSFEQSLLTLSNLQCLSLEHNSAWLKSSSFKHIGNLRHLKTLNINYNSLSIDALVHISSLNKLRTLLCAGNDFNYLNLGENIHNYQSGLKKLSIGFQQKSKIVTDWQFLNNRFSKLNHLKITNFRFQYVELQQQLNTESFLPNLKSLTFVGVNFKRNLSTLRQLCQKRGIQIVLD